MRPHVCRMRNFPLVLCQDHLAPQSESYVGPSEFVLTGAHVWHPRGFIGGFFPGHQIKNLRGIICLTVGEARRELVDNRAGLSDIFAKRWAEAACAATDICLAKRFAGEFFTGYQSGVRKNWSALSISSEISVTGTKRLVRLYSTKYLTEIGSRVTFEALPLRCKGL